MALRGLRESYRGFMMVLTSTWFLGDEKITSLTPSQMNFRESKLHFSSGRNKARLFVRRWSIRSKEHLRSMGRRR